MMLPYWHDSPDPVPGSERAVCGHPAGCSCPPCVKQRALIAAGEADAAELVRQERARRQAARIQADRDLEPEWDGCACPRCKMRKTELVLGDAAELIRQERAADAGTVDVTAPEDRERTSVPAEPEQIQAGSITSGKITADIPGTAGFYGPGGREKTPVPAEPPAPDPAGEVEAALRDFDAWYAAGRGCLPEPEPLPAGTCVMCHLSPAVTLSGRCSWCHLAETVRQENAARPGEAAAARRRYAVSKCAVTGVIAVLAVWVTVVILVVAGVLS